MYPRIWLQRRNQYSPDEILGLSNILHQFWFLLMYHVDTPFLAIQALCVGCTAVVISIKYEPCLLSMINAP